MAIAFPLSRESASAEDADKMPEVAVSGGLVAAMQSQAQTVAAAMAQADTADAGVGVDGYPGAELVPRPVLVLAARVLAQGALAGPDGQQAMAMELQAPVRFTLHEDGFASSVFSTRPTVGLALAALGSDFARYDWVWPSPDTPLSAGLHVFVDRATVVRLSVGGKKASTVQTHARTVADLLAERGVEMLDTDSVSPGPAAVLSNGMAISVTVVRTVEETEDTPIAFATVYEDDASMLEGEYAEVQSGLNGVVRRVYSVTYKNGVEIGRELLSEVTYEPTDRIVAQGTGVAVAAVAAVPAGDPQCARSLTVWATWYTAASAGGGYTATGTVVQKGTVAVDPRVIPLGTRMYIPGYGYGTAEDTGGAIIGNIIDLGYGANDVVDWRSGWVTICILN